MAGRWFLRLLALQMLVHSAWCDDVSCPLDDCETVRTLDGTEITDATLSSLGSDAGPYNYDVYAFANPSSSLTIPQSSINLSTLKAICFNIRLNSHNQDKDLLQIMSSSGHYFKVKQQGSDLVIEATFNATQSGLESDITQTFTSVPLNSWLSVRASVGLSAVFNTNAFGAGLNSALNISSRRYPDFSLGDIQVFSFDGALSCLTLSNNSNPNPAILANTACSGVAPAVCPPPSIDETTTTVEPDDDGPPGPVVFRRLNIPNSNFIPDRIRVKVQSCGRARGIEMSETEEGLVSEEGALSAASSAINLIYVARLECDTQDTKVVLLELAPGIEIYQLGDKVYVKLTFVSESGDETEMIEEVEVDVGTGHWRLIWRLARRQRWRRLRRNRRRHNNPRSSWPRWPRWFKKWHKKCGRTNNQCAVAIFLHHNPETGETALYVDGNEINEDFGDTQGLVLPTTGQVFIRKDNISCFKVKNKPKNLFGPRHRMLGCFPFVCRRKDCSFYSSSESEDNDIDP